MKMISPKSEPQKTHMLADSTAVSEGKHKDA